MSCKLFAELKVEHSGHKALYVQGNGLLFTITLPLLEIYYV